MTHNGSDGGPAVAEQLTPAQRPTVCSVEELRTRAGAKTPLYNAAGDQVAELHTTLFGHRLANVREGASVHLGNRAGK